MTLAAGIGQIKALRAQHGVLAAQAVGGGQYSDSDNESTNESTTESTTDRAAESADDSATESAADSAADITLMLSFLASAQRGIVR